MIAPEIYARIRRLFYAEHWKVGTIAQELGVHHDTVRRALGAFQFVRSTGGERRSILDSYKSVIISTLKTYPKLRSTRLYEMIKARGYTGSVVQLRRYVRFVRPSAAPEAYLMIRTLPGEQAQVDWGHFGKVRVGRALRPLSCFVMVLGYSRALYARFTLDQRLESFLYCHVQAFEAFGGAPREILYDNLKSVVLERQGDHIRFHPQLLELAAHYHFAPKPCAPYRGNEKGKVERTIQYLRHGFFEARHFSNIDELNRDLLAWIHEVADKRAVPADPDRRLIKDAFKEERLIQLPQNRFECELVKPVTSGKTPYIRFDLNDYSIPHEWVRRTIVLLASEILVRFTDEKGTLIATHPRSYDRGVIVEDPKHLEGLANMKRHAKEIRGRDRLSIACPSAKKLLEALYERGVPLAHQTTQLLRLLEHYPAAEVDMAIQSALERGAISAVCVAHMLDQKAREQNRRPPIPIILPDDPRVRELTVTPHELSLYDSLSNTERE